MRQGPGGMEEPRNVARVIALIAGVAYLAIGVIGFAATGFSGFVSDGDDELLGFDLNIFHNIVHLAIGAGLLAASRARDVSITQGILIGGGLVYILAALLGFLNYLQILSIDAHLAVDNFLHLVTGAVAFIFGVAGVLQRSDTERAGGSPLESGESLGSVAAARGGIPPIEERRALWDR